MDVLLRGNSCRCITHDSEVKSRLPRPDDEFLARGDNRRVDSLRVLESGLLDEAGRRSVIVVDAGVGLGHRLVVDGGVERVVVAEEIIGTGDRSIVLNIFVPTYAWSMD